MQMLQVRSNQSQRAFTHCWQCIQKGLHFPKVSHETIDAFGKRSPEQCSTEDRKTLYVSAISE